MQPLPGLKLQFLCVIGMNSGDVLVPLASRGDQSGRRLNRGSLEMNSHQEAAGFTSHQTLFNRLPYSFPSRLKTINLGGVQIVVRAKRVPTMRLLGSLLTKHWLNAFHIHSSRVSKRSIWDAFKQEFAQNGFIPRGCWVRCSPTTV